MADGDDTTVPDGAMLAALEAARGSLAERMGIEVTTASLERVVATMPVEGNTQPYGLLHGGASCVLAESVASLGSALHGWPDRSALGIEINASHHRPAESGVVTAVGVPLRLGASLATWDVRISDAAGRLVCTARVTCALRSV